MNIKQLSFTIAVYLIIHSVNGQSDSLTTIDLKIVELKASRIEVDQLQQPVSISVYEAGSIQETRQQLSLQEYISQVPGLFSLNANNYAQDLRISIRGFGARSSFGIRGIKLIVDGIPETTPDGQGQIDNLNLGSIERIEVLKGPSSALYGNASGGAVQISTQADFDNDYLQLSATAGSFNFQQYQISAGLKDENTKAIINAGHTQTDGYRDQSRLISTNLNARVFQKINDKNKINFQLNYTLSPIADDPGGLTKEAVIENPKQAFSRNILFQTGESINHFKLGTALNSEINKNNQLNFYGFYSHRGFEGRIPVENDGWIDLNRDYFGQGSSYRWTSDWSEFQNKLQVGYDWAFQNDRRKRYENLNGQQGRIKLNQLEQFNSFGIYALNNLEFKKWLFSAGVRYDFNTLRAVDRKLDDGDQSAKRTLPAFSPSLGINYQINRRLYLYGNYRTAFETPSLSELSANPEGSSGFNQNLEPQKADNYELGIRGSLLPKLGFDFTIFHIDTTNDLVPFELENNPGRTYYRNAGSTQRDGAEIWLNYEITNNLAIQTSYTYSNFKYEKFVRDDEDFSGNELPGIPKHNVSAALKYSSESNFNAQLQYRYRGAFYANDANSIEAQEPSANILDLSVGHRLSIGKTMLTPFFGINNILDNTYSDNVRLNAFGDRYFEPAPGINFYGGIRWQL